MYVLIGCDPCDCMYTYLCIYLCVAFESFGFLRADGLGEQQGVSNNVQSSGPSFDSESSQIELVSERLNEKSGASRKRKLSSDHLSGVKYLKPSVVNAEFLDLKKQLEDILQACDAQKLFKECKNLMASQVHNIPLFSEEYLQSMNECNFAPAVLQMLSPFFTWSDHSVLTAAVKACGIPEALELLQQFDSQIDLSLPITEYSVPQPVPSMAPYDSSTHTALAVKLNTELSKFSLQQVIELRCLIQKHFQITEHSLQLMAVKSSSTILYWVVPRSITHLINSQIIQDPSLYGNKVEEVSIYPGTLFVSASTLKLGSLSFLNQINEMVSMHCLSSSMFILLFYEQLPRHENEVLSSQLNYLEVIYVAM